MKTGILIKAFLWITIIMPVALGDSKSRIVIIQLPINKVAGARSILSEFSTGSTLEAVDAVLMRERVTALADLRQENPWRSEPLELFKALGEIEIGGEKALDLGVKLRLEGSKFDGRVEEMLSSEILIPTTGKGYRQFQNLGNQLPIASGRWQERARWGDANTSLMIWQFSTIDAHDFGGNQIANNPKVSMYVEMHWMQAPEVDLSKLAQSKPETREKAFQWLSGRARLWKECGFWARQDEKAVWSATEGKLALQGKEAVAEERPFSIVGGFSGTSDLKMEWKVMFGNKGREWSRLLSSVVTPGVWEFITIEGLAEANVVAFRLSRD